MEVTSDYSILICRFRESPWQREYFVGDALSLADWAFASQIVNVGHGASTWTNSAGANLVGLFSRLKARSSMQGLLPAEQKYCLQCVSVFVGFYK